MRTLTEEKSPDKNRKTERPLPSPAQRSLKKLGKDLNRARRRRNLTQAALAERAGVGLSTVKRLEAGDPNVQIHTLVRVLHLFGELQRLDVLLDSGNDSIGLALADDQLPQRVRSPKKPVKSF